MVEQLGSPTLFFTISAADLQWKELYRLLDPNGQHVPFQNEYLETRRRTKLFIDNPLKVATFFKLIFDYFIFNILFPKYHVIDHWFRVEEKFLWKLKFNLKNCSQIFSKSKFDYQTSFCHLKMRGHISFCPAPPPETLRLTSWLENHVVFLIPK